MDSSEMEDIIKATGWTPIQRKRRNARLYLYISKRAGGKKVERYLGAISTVKAMSVEQFRSLLIEKISK